MEASFISRLGRLHFTLRGEGARTLNSIVETCKQMLKDRGCDKIVTEEVIPSFQGGRAKVMAGEGGEKAYNVFLIYEEKVGVKAARALIDECHGVTPIVLSLEGATPFTRKECEGKDIEFFNVKDLCKNITRHCLVPVHEKVDSPPPSVTHTSLPKILDTDKVVQYYGWRAGDIVRIRRIMGGHEPTFYYRIVVPTPASMM